MYLATLLLCSIELVEMPAAYKLATAVCYVLHTFVKPEQSRKISDVFVKVISTT